MITEGVTEIALDGGACGGKTTAQTILLDKMMNMGYRAWFVPEAATMCILGGVSDIGHIVKNDPIKFFELERQILLMQRSLRKSFNGIASTFPDDKRVIFYDRAEMDIKAFLGEEGFKALLQEERLSLYDVRDSYDAVIHLVTAALGAEQFYTLANNKARRETLEEAREQDTNIIRAWMGTPHLKIIDNSVDFEHKMKRVLQAVYRVLGIPAPIEIERKFLLKARPDFSLEIFRDQQTVAIEQFYLIGDTDEEVRVRRRTQWDSSAYFKTIKRFITSIKRHETEQFIRARDYFEARKLQLPNTRVIKKDRHCFVWRNQYFELDVFLDPYGLCLLEIELTEENDKVELPPGILIEREVTEDKNYSNRTLAEIRF